MHHSSAGPDHCGPTDAAKHCSFRKLDPTDTISAGYRAKERRIIGLLLGTSELSSGDAHIYGMNQYVSEHHGERDSCSVGLCGKNLLQICAADACPGKTKGK